MSDPQRSSFDLRPARADLAAVDRVMAAAFDPRFGEAWTRGQCLGVLAHARRLADAARRSTTCPPASRWSARSLDEAELLLLAVAARRAPPRHRPAR